MLPIIGRVIFFLLLMLLMLHQGFRLQLSYQPSN